MNELNSGSQVINLERRLLARFGPVEPSLSTTEFRLRPDIELRFDRFRLWSRLAIDSLGRLVVTDSVEKLAGRGGWTLPEPRGRRVAWCGG
jgi:hypothetical protein